MTCTCKYNDKLIWGQHLWRLLHSIPYKLTNSNNKDKAIKIIQKFYSLLPCNECYDHAKLYLSKNNINIETNNLEEIKQILDKYIFDFHNTVNVRLKKDIKKEYKSYDLYKQTKALHTIDMSEIRKIYRNKHNNEFFVTHHTEHERRFIKDFFIVYGKL